MKITVITGSPRKNGNTFALVDAFVKAAEARGHEIVRFDAAMMKIDGCHACMTCFKTGKACSFDDDFNIIAQRSLRSYPIFLDGNPSRPSTTPTATVPRSPT